MRTFSFSHIRTNNLTSQEADVVQSTVNFTYNNWGLRLDTDNRLSYLFEPKHNFFFNDSFDFLEVHCF
jgi:hypothetical protein